jgi:cytochrome c
MIMRGGLALIGLAGFVLASAPATAGDAERGKALYHICSGCHSEKPKAIGPSLIGVIGRKAGSLKDFIYSRPMRHAEIVWDEGNLRSFLQNPQSVVKGTLMGFGGLRNDAEADDVIAYLKTLP